MKNSTNTQRAEVAGKKKQECMLGKRIEAILIVLKVYFFFIRALLSHTVISIKFHSFDIVKSEGSKSNETIRRKNDEEFSLSLISIELFAINFIVIFVTSMKTDCFHIYFPVKKK